MLLFLVMFRLSSVQDQVLKAISEKFLLVNFLSARILRNYLIHCVECALRSKVVENKPLAGIFGRIENLS